MFIGIDIGGTNIKGILTDKNGKELSFAEISNPHKKGVIEESIYQLVENLSTSASVSKIDINAIGIGSAGTIDRNKGTIITSPNIKALKNYPLSKNIEKLTGIKVFLENDATIALIGGWWKGHGTRFKNWIMVTLGTGIGGGVIIDNKIYTGQTGSAMEIGHMTIDYNGRKCNCGSNGCFEQYASVTSLINFIKKHQNEYPDSLLNEEIKNDKELTGKKIYEMAIKGDELAKAAFKEISYFLGVGIANLINIFNPEAIIFGGGLSEAHKLFIPEMKKIINKRALHGVKENIKFLPIKDQQKIPAFGAAKMAIDSFNMEK